MITFREGRQTGSRFELIFQVADSARRASIILGPTRRPDFPNVLAESGASLGSPEADEAVRREAEVVVALLEAAQAWRDWTGDP